MKQSLPERIENYLRNWKERAPDKWFPKGDLEYLAKEAGFLGDNCTRRLREMENDGILEAKYNDKGHVLYQFKW